MDKFHALPSYFGRILPALGTIFALPTHWMPLTVSLASHLFDALDLVVSLDDQGH